MSLVIDIVGWFGIVAVLLAFALTSWGVISQGWTSNILNLAGAIAIVIQTGARQVYQPAVLNTIWALIAVFAILRLKRNPERQENPDEVPVNTVVVPVVSKDAVKGPGGVSPGKWIFHFGVLLFATLYIVWGGIAFVIGEKAFEANPQVMNILGTVALAAIAFSCLLNQYQSAALAWALHSVAQYAVFLSCCLFPLKRWHESRMMLMRNVKKGWRFSTAYWQQSRITVNE